MRITSFRAVFAISFVMLTAVFAYPGPGKLDFTFAGTGYKFDGFPGGMDNARKTAVQPDGKIVVAGYTSKHGSIYNVVVARYNADGTPDTTFNGEGKVVTTFGLGSGQGASVAIQPDGKIIVAGYFAAGESAQKDFLVLRYNANGTLDTTFDGDGKVITPVLSGDDQALDVAIQADGKIVAAGPAGIVRYNSNGSLDSTFGTGGISSISSVAVTSMAIHTDGKIVTAGLVFGNFFGVARHNTDGSLDLGFDGDGIVTTSIFGFYDVANSVTIEPGGKIVAAGAAYHNASNPDFVLVRYNTDGSLDTTFDGDGKLIATITSQDGGEVARAVAVQPNGRIVAAGSASEEFALIRVMPDGSFDTSFDGDGKVITGIYGTDIAHSLVIQPDGKLVAGGDTRPVNSNAWDFAVVRYNADGSLDTGLDGDGRVAADVGWGPSWGRDVVVQSDGKIVTLVNAGAYSFGLARYDPDGVPDPSFGVGGKTYTIFSGYSYPSDLLLQPNGKIVAIGQAGTEFNARIGLVRFNPDGSRDPAFGSDGKVVTAVPGTGFCAGVKAAIQPDGKIVVLGYATVSVNPPITRYLVITRYNTDGSLDTSFDGDGVLTTNAMNDIEGGHSLTVQPDGKILVGGAVGGYHAEVFALARYNPNGSVDTSFDGDGLVTTQMQPGGWSWINSTVVLPDGRIVVGGYTNNGSNSDFALARYNPNGSLDTTFDGDGKVITPLLSGNDNLYHIAIQSDGKIVAAGDTHNGVNTDMALVRYNSDGSLDTIYGSGGKSVINLGLNDAAYGMALDGTDKAVVIGSGYDFITARITSDFAPLVDVGGRVTSSANGQGIGNAQVVLRDVNNNRRYALTNAFGYYIFSGVSSNEVYVVSASSKRYRIQPLTQTIILTGAVSNVDFVGNPGSESKVAEPETKISPGAVEKDIVKLPRQKGE